MHTTIRFGRIAGIPVGAHWTTMVMLVLLASGIATGVLPEASPDLPAAVRWPVAVATALVFLGGLVLHELAHSVVARRSGMAIEGITLWMFGGVSRLTADPPDPSTELRMALAGPATSFGLAVGAFVLASGLAPVGDVAVVPLLWLAAMNLILAVFNLLPAFPLDGGRVLRALLWRRWDDLQRATVAAAAAGQGIGFALVGFGMLTVVGGGGVGGLWVMFIGWYLLGAAASEAQTSQLRTALEGMRVADVMSPDPVTVPADLAVSDLLEHYVLAHRHSAYPVVDGLGRLVGLVTLDDVRRLPRGQRATAVVGEVATAVAEVPQAGPDDAVFELLARLGRESGRRVLVVDHDRLVGIVTPLDIQRALQVGELRAAR